MGNQVPNCLQGQQLPANWRQLAPGAARQAEAAYLDRLQNAWRSAPQQPQSPIHAARLTNDAADPAHNAHQSRFDGQMVLERSDANGFETWRDLTTGAIIRRRLTWRDLIGDK
jgi:hypothetical protein